MVPFVGGTVGFGFANSKGLRENNEFVGIGQDFCFQFTVEGGVRYDINDEWYLRLSGIYTHFSNAGQSEPERPNHAIDQMGPELVLGYRF